MARLGGGSDGLSRAMGMGWCCACPPQCHSPLLPPLLHPSPFPWAKVSVGQREVPFGGFPAPLLLAALFPTDISLGESLAFAFVEPNLLVRAGLWAPSCAGVGAVGVGLLVLLQQPHFFPPPPHTQDGLREVKGRQHPREDAVRPW